MKKRLFYSKEKDESVGDAERGGCEGSDDAEEEKSVDFVLLRRDVKLQRHLRDGFEDELHQRQQFRGGSFRFRLSCK